MPFNRNLRQLEKVRGTAVKCSPSFNQRFLNTFIYEECSILHFDSYNEKWLDFILLCRTGKKIEGYDLIEGGVANDRVFNTIELFLSNLIDKKEVMKRLKYEKPNWQICFKKQEAIDKYLKFIGSEKI